MFHYRSSYVCNEADKVRVRTLCCLNRQDSPRVSDGSVDDKAKGVADETDIDDSSVTKQSDEVVYDEEAKELEYTDHHVVHTHHQLRSTCQRIYDTIVEFNVDSKAEYTA